MQLKDKKCVPCEGGVPPLKAEEINMMLKLVHSDWVVKENKKISRSLKFVNFIHALEFVNKVAEVAEEEGHHPDLHLGYGYCDVELWTHAINGLSENDFILAAKIDALV